jgi:pyruvate dehydrogenase E1 component beta subunit
MFMNVPGIMIVLPSTPYDAKGLLKTALREDNPILFFEHKRLYEAVGPVPEGEYTIPFGVAEVRREGKDVTVVATSYMVQMAIAAAERLQERGVNVEVMDLRTLVPLDRKAIIESVKKTGKIVIVDEAPRTCGAAAEIAAIVSEEAFDYLDAPIRRVTALDVPIPYSLPMEKYVLPAEEKVIEAVMSIAR